MLLDIILEINKEKLDNMIFEQENYQNILAQSQKVDKYVSSKFRLMNPALKSS